MPTAVKLAAAILFAAIAAATSEYVQLDPPDGFRDFWVTEISAGIGLLFGWRVMSGLVGGSYLASLGGGLQTIVMQWVATMAVFGVMQALRLSMKLRYDGVLDVFVGAVTEGFEFALVTLQPVPIAIMLGGSALAGLISEFVYRRWD